MLKDVVEYFENFRTGNSISKDLLNMMKESVKSLETLSILVQSDPLRTSALGTNIVENFFSQIRRKQRYFSVWEYSCIYNRAIHELMKRNCYDLPYSYPTRKNNAKKKYNSQIGLVWSIKDVKLMSPLKREKYIESLRVVHKGSAEEESKCTELAANFNPSRRMLTIREATCKLLPFGADKIHYLCPVEDCLAMYVHIKRLTSHLQLVMKKKLSNILIKLKKIQQATY